VKKFSYISIIILLLFIKQNIALGQSSYGFNFGVAIGGNGELMNNSKDSINTFKNGYQVGILGTFGTYSFFISPGIYYEDITINKGYSKVDPFIKSPRMKLAKAKVVMGYQTNLLTKRVKFKIGGGVNGSYLLNIAENDMDYTFNNLEDNYLGYSIDLGLDFFFININLSYEKSLKNTFTKLDNKHKSDFLILSAGVSF
jgi:hypothetical protein